MNGIDLVSTTQINKQANDALDLVTMSLAGALAATNTASFSVGLSDSIAIGDTRVTTETRTDTIGQASSSSDTTTIVTSGAPGSPATRQ